MVKEQHGERECRPDAEQRGYGDQAQCGGMALGLSVLLVHARGRIVRLTAKQPDMPYRPGGQGSSQPPRRLSLNTQATQALKIALDCPPTNLSLQLFLFIFLFLLSSFTSPT